LGDAYSHYDDHECAALQFNAAASLTHSDEDRIRWFGNQVHHLVAGGKTDEARKVLSSLRDIAQKGVEAEKAYLRVARDYAKQTKDEELEVAALERTIELSPDDSDLRFALAYKHSESDRNDLSLAHYLNIDVERRTALTWNNLGVAYEQLAMPAKSITAYKCAKSGGETLAMSNLANRLMHTGFLEEAQAELDEAIKTPEYSNNVNHSLARIRDIPADEDKKLAALAEEIRSKADFYRAVGRAISKPGSEHLDFAKWEGPDCTLEMRFNVAG
jgi:Flp pilus assembly protein TadD